MKEQESRKDNNLTFLVEEDYETKIEQIVRPILKSNGKSGYFHSFDHTSIFYEFYIHPEPRATIVISHGFCEFTAKFEEVIFYFFQAGYSVFIFDHRGHGYSNRIVKEPCMVHVSSYDDYVLDLHNFVQKIVTKKCPKEKLVLYGHSMGGAIAALYLEQFPEVFTCAVLSSPMFQIIGGFIPTTLAWFVLQINKLIRKDKAYVIGHKAFDAVPSFETSSCLSKARYDHIFKKRLKNENYQTNGASYGWTLASMKAIRRLHKHARLIVAPILLFQAEKDTTVKPKGQMRFANNTKNTQLVVIPDSKHEIYNGNTKILEEYYNKIIAFLDETLKQ